MAAAVRGTGCDCGERVGVASAALWLIRLLGRLLAYGVKGDLLDSKYVLPFRAGAGEDPAADDRLSVSHRVSAAVWQAGTGAVEPIRPGGAAEPFEHGAE